MITFLSSTRFAAPALAGAVLAAGLALPAEAGRLRAVKAQPGGGVSTASVAGRLGPHGGYAARSGHATAGPDGSAAHTGRFVAANARGSITGTSSASRDGQGNASASRQTTFTNSATGNSAHVSSSYSRTDGGVSGQRTVSCQDATGQAIACR